MGALDKGLGAAASAAVSAVGASVSYIRDDPGRHDVRSGNFVGALKTTRTIKVAPPESFSVQEMDLLARQVGKSPDVLRSTDFKILVPRTIFPSVFGEPKPESDYMMFAGTKYRVVGIYGTLWSGDLVAAWVLHCRR